MLDQKSSQASAPDSTAEAPAAAPAAARDLESVICYFEGEYVPLRDAKVSIMTHAFMYGTAVFEGIRAYWNEEQGTLFGLKIREHVERIRQSCRIMLMENVPSVDELTGLIVETVRRNGFREDVYIRPSFYKSTKAIGVRLHHLENQLYIITIPFGNYIDTESGVRVACSEKNVCRTTKSHSSPASAIVRGPTATRPSGGPPPSRPCRLCSTGNVPAGPSWSSTKPSVQSWRSIVR